MKSTIPRKLMTFHLRTSKHYIQAVLAHLVLLNKSWMARGFSPTMLKIFNNILIFWNVLNINWIFLIVKVLKIIKYYCNLNDLVLFVNACFLSRKLIYFLPFPLVFFLPLTFFSQGNIHNRAIWPISTVLFYREVTTRKSEYL